MAACRHRGSEANLSGAATTRRTPPGGERTTQTLERPTTTYPGWRRRAEGSPTTKARQPPQPTPRGTQRKRRDPRGAQHPTDQLRRSRVRQRAWVRRGEALKKRKQAQGKNATRCSGTQASPSGQAGAAHTPGTSEPCEWQRGARTTASRAGRPRAARRRTRGDGAGTRTSRDGLFGGRSETLPSRGAARGGPASEAAGRGRHRRGPHLGEGADGSAVQEEACREAGRTSRGLEGRAKRGETRARLCTPPSLETRTPNRSESDGAGGAPRPAGREAVARKARASVAGGRARSHGSVFGPARR
jgi:hypothetical protein